MYLSFTGRCYIPHDYLKGDELKHLTDKKPHRVPSEQLKRYAEKMLDIADNFANESIGAISLLPDQCRRAVLLTFKTYQGMCILIRKNSHYERRTSLSKVERVLIALKCMYFTSPALINERSK